VCRYDQKALRSKEQFPMWKLWRAADAQGLAGSPKRDAVRGALLTAVVEALQELRPAK
jgi:hypothetical protein